MFMCDAPSFAANYKIPAPYPIKFSF